MDKTDFLLVSMPWAPPSEPSIALGILKECLSKNQIKSKIFHAAPYLLKWLSRETYRCISDIWGVNDFLFTSLIDPQCDDKQVSALLKVLNRFDPSKENNFGNYPTLESFAEVIFKLRDEVIPLYLDYCAKKILSHSPRIVGFSCMFDQTIASIALAKILKEYDPSLFIVFGGYALEDTAGKTVANAFPYIDLIVQGEGEEIIVQIAEHIINAKPFRKPLNKIIKTPRINLETSPAPDYTDWFEEINLLYETDKIKINTVVLPVESSRGCWWGQVKHCVFCGIDEETLKYTQKSAETTINMLRELRKKNMVKAMYIVFQIIYCQKKILY